jgi:hypothetical protein
MRQVRHFGGKIIVSDNYFYQKISKGKVKFFACKQLFDT